jgi:hypothetical protein
MELVECTKQGRTQDQRGTLITKRLIIVFAMFLIAGCTPAPASSPQTPTPVSGPGARMLFGSSGIQIQAIYLVQGTGQLSPEDLQAHPEVLVTDDFEEFKDLAKSLVALWIDINSVGLVDVAWLGESPQKFYPVAVIGDSNQNCVFFVNMSYFLFEGPPPPPDLDCSIPQPGFSVNQLESEGRGKMHGYEEVPTVQGVLDRTMIERVK